MDPISAALAAVTVGKFALTTAEEIGQLIERLQDHKRTLEQAEAERRAASAALDTETPATPAD